MSKPFMPAVTRTVLSFLLLAALVSACPAARPQVTATPDVTVTATAPIPDTAAGQQLTAWLRAFNTGQRDVVRRFVAERFESPPDRPLPLDDITERELQLYRTTRGFEVRKIVASSSAMISALVQANWTGIWMKIDIYISAEPPEYKVAKAPFKIVGIGRSTADAPTELLPRQPLTLAEIAARTDTLLAKLVEADAFSGTVTLARDGQPFYRHASGLASRSWNMPNRHDTRFNLASITKMFTTVAIAQLVEQGKLAYDDTVGEILPDYPNEQVARTVTVHHLLSHTSGIIGARALIEKAPGSRSARTIAEMLTPFVAEPLSFPPGEKFDYSNAGYVLLGAILERASGLTYYEYMRERVFGPAGMKDTDFYALDTDPPNLAEGFVDGPNGSRLNNIFDLGVIGSPAGGAYATGEDMARFHRALVQHKLVSAQSLATLWTGVMPRGAAMYGYGAEIEHYNGTRLVSHGGGWKGITNHFEMYPELGYTVVILSNFDDDPRAIASKLREWLTQGARPH
ncbi:serine hydrolase domain-containing protein [Nannocystis radixulma]|uniref:Serine hydrolase n=1 Tax=Nannocystis radixulma TaxID=2995305 RepID=A0ABT5BHB5_9BACT|nr:serine hydrolase domain-containing protein [Nannocystis radixulma]MDC0673482.1 serine hydrolase [Nannocystis radixulma]